MRSRIKRYVRPYQRPRFNPHQTSINNLRTEHTSPWPKTVDPICGLLGKGGGGYSIQGSSVESASSSSCVAAHSSSGRVSFVTVRHNRTRSRREESVLVFNALTSLAAPGACRDQGGCEGVIERALLGFLPFWIEG